MVCSALKTIDESKIGPRSTVFQPLFYVYPSKTLLFSIQLQALLLQNEKYCFDFAFVEMEIIFQITHVS